MWTIVSASAGAVDDKPKPTVALEYTFGRRSNTTSNVKDIAHIWELGGGVRLRELINVPITPQRTPNAVVVVVVDLSKVGGPDERCARRARRLYPGLWHCVTRWPGFTAQLGVELGTDLAAAGGGARA